MVFLAATAVVGILLVVLVAVIFRGERGREVPTSVAPPSTAQSAAEAVGTAPAEESSAGAIAVADMSAGSPAMDGGSNQTGSVEFDSQSISREIRDRYSEYLSFLTAPKLASSGDIWKRATSEFDSLLRESIERAFGKFKDFQRVRAVLQDTVKWQEIPDEIVVTGLPWEDILPDGMGTDLGTTEIPQDALPIVLYKHASLSSGGELTVLQQVLLTKDLGNTLQTRSGPYAVVSNETDVIVGGVGESGPLPWISIVDILDVGDSVPWVALVMGPRGNGLYVDIGFYSFDEAKGAWKPEQIHRAGEWSDVSRWSYDDNTHEFAVTYEDRDYQTTTDTFSFLDVAQESMARRSER